MSGRIYKEIDKKTLKKLHETELEILEEIDKICKKHKIKYFLFAGSLLGAIRHKGFIPWDDDLDIGMFREDYEKFIDIAIEEIDDKYFVHCDKTDEHYWLPFLKIRKNKTTFDEKITNGKKVLHNGIFVDVFPLDPSGNTYIINKLKASVIRTCSDSILVKSGRISYKESRHPIINRMIMPISLKTIRKIQYRFIRMSKRRDNYVDWLGVYKIKKEIFPYDYVKQLITVKFEGKDVKIFKEYDKVLTLLYGDYMTLPPKDERVNHGAEYISFDKGANVISRDMKNNNGKE